MECFKMFYILLNLLFVAIKVSDAINAEFQGIEPQTVVVGSNVTFHWQYTGAKIPQIAEFRVLEGSQDTRLIYYAFGADGKPIPYPAVEKYATGGTSVGNVSNNEFAFMLTRVKESSHKKNFSLHIQYKDVSRENFYTKDLFFISVPPKVDLKINKNNVFVGDRVNMECNQLSQGRPKATISWYHNNGSVLEKNEKSFIIDEIELKDAGTYKCIAQNKAGKSESKEKRIVVNEKQNPGGEENPTGGKSSGSSGGLSGGAIAGIVVAILVVIVIVLVVVFVVMRGKNKSESKKKPTANGDETKSPMVGEKTQKDQVWL